MDIFFSNGAASPSLEKKLPAFSNRLYRNNCDGTFTDVTASPASPATGYSNGVAAADYDNDGFTDLFVAGVGRNILYHNRGDGTFEDVTAKAGLDFAESHWSVSAGWFDADNDGYLDLFVTNYVAWSAASERPCGAPGNRLYCHPNSYQAPRTRFSATITTAPLQTCRRSPALARQSEREWEFRSRTWTATVCSTSSSPTTVCPISCFTIWAVFGFSEMGYEMGVALPEPGRAIAGMGTDFRDYDNDGQPDLIVTGMVNDAFQLFRNLGRLDGFDDYTARAGLADTTRKLTGWATGFFDFDNDGFKDLFFANSHFPELGRYLGAPAPLANRVFRNTGKRFEDVSPAAGADFQAAAFFRGAAFADFDNDGKVDVVVTAIGSEALLLRNVSVNENHWLAFKLRGTKSNRDGIGTRMRLKLSDGRTIYNHATTSVGYASSSERIVRFGLGGARVAREVEIAWPSGIVLKLN